MAVTDTPDDQRADRPLGQSATAGSVAPTGPPAAVADSAARRPSHLPESQQPGYARPDYGQYPPTGEQYPPPGGQYPAAELVAAALRSPGRIRRAMPNPVGVRHPKTEGMAIGALVCGILGTLCGVIGCFGLLIGPVGIVLGVVARRRIRESGGLTKGEGLALAGLVLGIIGTVASVGWLIAFADRARAARSLERAHEHHHYSRLTRHSRLSGAATRPGAARSARSTRRPGAGRPRTR